MRINQIKAKNFASYAEIEFDFRTRGLTLIHGATGSGKSTLCDLVPWCLFGKTAKNGAADEIRPWATSEPTSVTVYLDSVTISRKRGNSGKDNDLCFWPTDGVVTRGKDLTDTQKLINQFLGIDIDLYLASVYFHEFSQTAGFFTAAAKQRRLICEQIVDLSLPIKLAERATERAKVIKGDMQTLQTSVMEAQTRKSTILSTYKQMEMNSTRWISKKGLDLSDLQARKDNFQNEVNTKMEVLVDQHAKLEASLHQIPKTMPSAVCEHCGAPSKKARHIESLKNENRITQLRMDNITKELQDLVQPVNPYDGMIQQLMDTKNPYAEQAAELKAKYEAFGDSQDTGEAELKALSRDSQDLEALLDVTATARSMLIEQAIANIVEMTNTYLSEYFDAELKVEFTVIGADKLDVTIYKDGNTCSYTQLSKGQRQLLKLCFGVAVMKQAANNSLTNFTQLFFDESLDGMDETTKVKAFSLFQSLATEYESIFVVEHSSAFQELFENRVKIQLIDGNSEIVGD